MQDSPHPPHPHPGPLDPVFIEYGDIFVHHEFFTLIMEFFKCCIPLLFTLMTEDLGAPSMVMAKQLVHFLHPGPHPRTDHPQHSHQILTLSFSQARVTPPTPSVHYDPMPRWRNSSPKVLSEHFPLCLRGTKCTPPSPVRRSQ